MRIVFLLVFFPLISFCQKTQVNIYSASHIKKIIIDSDEIFEIKAITSDSKEITINTIIEGETFDSTLLKTEEKEGTLIISTGKTPDFIPYNDKLSAHKILSIELEIILPENLDLIVRSTLAQVQAQGNFRMIALDLGRGGFVGELLSYSESKINTISGNIDLTLKEGAISASTRNGNKNIALSLNSGPKCVINSIHGDIMVYQIN